MITTRFRLAGSLKRVAMVWVNQRLTFSRASSLMASSAVMGSSTTSLSPRRPVPRLAPTEVATISPLRVFLNHVLRFWSSTRAQGRSSGIMHSWYSGESIRSRRR